MTVEDIERLSRAARRAGIATLEWADQDGTLRFHFGPSDAAEAPAAADRESHRRDARSGRVIASPAVGRFRHRHPATGRPAAAVGARVEAGQIVGFVQAGVMLHPVVATEAGMLDPPTCPDGAPVGYGTPLFHLT